VRFSDGAKGGGEESIEHGTMGATQ